MSMSRYYQALRDKIGTARIFSPAVAAIIRDESGRILFVRSADDSLWSLPAGAIELGETPAQAVVREVYEETGLQVEARHLAGVFGGKEYRWTYPDGNQVEYLICLFDCDVVGGILHPVDGEAAELAYFAPNSRPHL